MLINFTVNKTKDKEGSYEIRDEAEKMGDEVDVGQGSFRKGKEKCRATKPRLIYRSMGIISCTELFSIPFCIVYFLSWQEKSFYTIRITNANLDMTLFRNA
jgi:hypothetical protein